VRLAVAGSFVARSRTSSIDTIRPGDRTSPIQRVRRCHLQQALGGVPAVLRRVVTGRPRDRPDGGEARRRSIGELEPKVSWRRGRTWRIGAVRETPASGESRADALAEHENVPARCR